MNNFIRARIPLLILLVLVVTTVTVLVLAGREPVISSLDPAAAGPGQTITIAGKSLGTSGRVVIDGLGLDSRYIRRWSPTLIVFTVPQNTRSGNVLVQTENGTSNPLFFSSTLDTPEVNGESLTEVTVETYDPESAGPGDVITLQGHGFGPAVGFSRVVFSDGSAEYAIQPGYPLLVSWSDREIEVVVPPGGKWTSLSVEPYMSRPVSIPFETRTPESLFEYGDDVRYAVFQSVVIPTGRLVVTLILPKVPVGSLQPVVQTLQTGDIQGVDIDDRFERVVIDVEPELPDQPDSTTVERSTMITRRSVRIAVDDTDLPDTDVLEGEEFRLGMEVFLSGTTTVDISDRALITLVRDSGALESESQLERVNRLLIKVYGVLEPDPDNGAVTIADAVASGTASSVGYSLVVEAAARSVGFPARRISGLLLPGENESVPHQWVEIFFVGLGWIPVDPALEDGMYTERFGDLHSWYEVEEGEDFRLDDRRIALETEGYIPAREYPGFTIEYEGSAFSLGNRRLEVQGVEAIGVIWNAPEFIGRY